MDKNELLPEIQIVKFYFDVFSYGASHERLYYGKPFEYY